MEYLDEFRIFYNHTIHPELVRMEAKRQRLFRTFGLACVATVAVVLVGFLSGIPIVGWLAMLLVIMLWISFGNQVYNYHSAFKPNIARLIIDFIDNRINFNDLTYEEKMSIPKGVFLESGLFPNQIDEYQGEDYIRGKIGELPFEMCELSVKRISPVRDRVEDVFRGVFLHATFSQSTGDGIMVVPRKQKQHIVAAIQAFASKGGKSVDHTIDNAAFGKVFTIIARENASYVGVLSLEMETAIYQYHLDTGKDIYMSFIGHRIFVAVTQDRDLLEPPLFYNNVSYDLVREFYDDLVMLMTIILDFDTNN